MDSGVNPRSLDVYQGNHRMACINNPTRREVLYWLGRLDCDHISEIVIADAHAWLDMTRLSDRLSICYRNDRLQLCQTEIVTDEGAAEWVLFFMGSIGRPSGAKRLAQPLSTRGNTLASAAAR
jgi:hypothetical protein